MKKILSIFGTRPEIIKMGPLCQCLNTEPGIEHRILFTGQHDELAQSYLELFQLKPDWNIKRSEPSLAEYFGELYKAIPGNYKPDLVVVHGDTLSAYAGALWAYYSGIKIAHVESGLRSWDAQNPWPEEFHRTSIDYIADYLFAPTTYNVLTLEAEKQQARVRGSIYLTGNTICDAIDLFPPKYVSENTGNNVLITLHRRESWGEPLKRICQAIAQLATDYPDLRFDIYSHPSTKEMIIDELAKESENADVFNSAITVKEPENDYRVFLGLIEQSVLVMSDSGGICEEATWFGKPLLILRDKTERPECLFTPEKDGNALLATTQTARITQLANRVLSDKKLYDKLARKRQTFGDGKAVERIVEILKK